MKKFNLAIVFFIVILIFVIVILYSKKNSNSPQFSSIATVKDLEKFLDQTGQLTQPRSVAVDGKIESLKREEFCGVVYLLKDSTGSIELELGSYKDSVNNYLNKSVQVVGEYYQGAACANVCCGDPFFIRVQSIGRLL